ncbi:unnamed protein product [Miscanthus lutarioriparius]|uniref:RING-type domain-containing protein n=1 Tax=Miscanthus lutarioriparius TaxID=422564 RepID=A0A811NI55_9POAL|nr:unnamed protein product [Miscanthus lutarioriparius]
MEVRAAPGSRPRPPTPRRGVTLAEQLAASSNLRDLLKLRDDDVDNGEGGEGRPAAAARRRTLLDAIRDADEGRRPPSVASGRRGVHPAPAPGGAGGTATAAPGSAARAESQRVSLMALLERTEQQQQWTWKRAGGAEEAAPVEEEEEKGGGVGGRCCVCVARGKGAAFIPCGHTFCRACARELRAGRGRCPLCNATIREVLNLF